MAGLLNRFPKELRTEFGSIMKGIDFTASNVPRPHPALPRGAGFLGQFAFGPMAGTASNVTLLSYLGDLNIGFNTRPCGGPRSRRAHGTRCARASTRSWPWRDRAGPDAPAAPRCTLIP